MFYLYGGGFNTGSRNLPSPFELIYSGLGAFFARQGFIVIIPDYRLAPEFQYPKPVEDVLEAIRWTLSHTTELVSEATPTPDIDSLFIAGHSAGASHATTLIFHPTLLPLDSDLRRKIKGVILMSGPYHYIPGVGEADRFSAYWGSEERAKENSSFSLLLSSLDTFPVTKLPKFLLVEAEHEPKWIFDVGIDFRHLLEWHLGEPIEMVVAEGHNHISLVCSLSSGEGEEWGIQTASWVRKLDRNHVRGFIPC